MLYCGSDSSPDQWAPTKHIDMLYESQKSGRIPKSISFTILENLQHDFVVHPEMISPVVNFCVSSILNALSTNLKAKKPSSMKSGVSRSRL